jgi:hydrogenase nickel incorporation protein HypA/HybF
MHELSIAMSIVEIAEENAAMAGVKSVSEIQIEVGNLSGVVDEALEFALEEAVKNTILKNAKRIVIKTPGKAKCLECNHEFDVDDVFTPCPKCSSFNNEIISGQELRVKSMLGE